MPFYEAYNPKSTDYYCTFFHGMVLHAGVCSRWGRCYSLPFTASNGVRQGGILSPLFFNVYMDELSVTLSNANLGCVMNGVFFNHLMYADDLVVIAPSPRAMQMLLNLCDNFARENHVIYNTKKTVCMCVKPNCFKSVLPQVLNCVGLV